MCLSIEWKLYTCRNSNREQLRKIHQLYTCRNSNREQLRKIHQGRSLLVLVDSCSRWPEVFILKSTTAAVIINRMKSCFAVHGLLEEIVTDNGPQFVAEEFDLYLREHGITHRRITSYWPQTNSEVERFNRTLEKAIRATNTEGKDWKNELNTFLLNYRATAHCTTGKSPTVLLFGREIRTKLPSLNTSSSPASTSPVVDPAILERDRCQKAKMKKYADEKRRAAPSNIKRGDKVLLKEERKNTLSTKYDPDPVVGTEGTSLFLKRRAEPEIKRNSSAANCRRREQIVIHTKPKGNQTKWLTQQQSLDPSDSENLLNILDMKCDIHTVWKSKTVYELTVTNSDN